MAVDRVLTNDEKETLQSDGRFLSQCNWAVKNFASYWTTDSETTAQVGAVGYYQWAKNRTFSAPIIQTGQVSDPHLAQEFAILLKGMNLWDSAITPFDTNTAIDYMVANGKFDELVTQYVLNKTSNYFF